MQRTLIVILIVLFILMVLRRKKATTTLRSRKRSLVNRMRETNRQRGEDEDPS